MSTLRIAFFGLLGIVAVLVVVTTHVRSDEARKKQGLKILREMTPESLVANCGQPSSDTGIHDHHGDPYLRSIEYKRENSPYWVKFQFTWDADKQWHFTNFASPSVGVSPSDDNSYIAISVFPCMAK